MKQETKSEKIVNLINKTFKERKRYPSEEEILAGDPKHIYTYIINSKMSKDEIPNWMITYISTSPVLSILISHKIGFENKDTLEQIAKSDTTSYHYAVLVRKGRFPEGEEIIMKSPLYRKEYLKFLKKIRDEQ